MLFVIYPQNDNLIPGLLFSSLVMAVLFPKVEVILGLSGATSGSFIGLIFPALIFLKLSDPGQKGRAVAKVILFIGLGELLDTVAAWGY